MIPRCKGCGIALQQKDRNAPGYTPKEDSEYCQRCFRLIHYDDLTVSMKTGIDPDLVYDEIAKTEGTILYVADLFDFEADMIAGLARKISERDIVLAVTKRDLLPETVSHEKIARFVFGRLREYAIHIRELILVSSFTKEGVEEVKDALRKYARGKPVIVMGRANSGKSTLLNAMNQSSVLTSSRYPGTTLDFNRITVDGIDCIDTPGIEIQHSMIMNVAENDLRTILPSRTVKPRVFQIHEDQSYFAGGLVRVDVMCPSKGTVTWYLGENVYLHRTKTSQADDLWKRQYGKLLVPVPLKNEFTDITYRIRDEKTDVVVDGLGWCCLSGDVTSVRVHHPKGVNITFRKAML